MKTNAPLIITINRQLGCGGAWIGQQLAQKMGISFADREIITQTAKELSVLEADVETRDEKVLSFWDTFIQYSAFAPDVFMPVQMLYPTNLELFSAESEIIRQIAQKQAAVIIGRCGFYILHDYPNRFSLFLHAEPEFRIKRLQDQLQITHKEAKSMIEESDKNRANYCKTYSNKEWTDARSYDLTIDTGKMGLETCVDFILNYLKQ